MALLRRGAKDAKDTAAPGGGQLEGVAAQDAATSPKAAKEAARAGKELERAERAERRAADLEAEAGGKDTAGEDKAEGKAEKKASKKADKASKKAGKKADKTSKKAGKKADKTSKKGGKGGDAEDSQPDLVTGSKVKRYIGIARVVIPVVTPLVYQAVGTVRAAWDARRARQLGVAPDELSEFTGRGAALYARIHNISISLRDLQDRRGDDAETRRFAADAESRLTDLEAAVRAAEQMPAARRRSAHAAVDAELDRVESRVLDAWGVTGAPRGAGSEGGAGH